MSGRDVNDVFTDGVNSSCTEWQKGDQAGGGGTDNKHVNVIDDGSVEELISDEHSQTVQPTERKNSSRKEQRDSAGPL